MKRMTTLGRLVELAQIASDCCRSDSDHRDRAEPSLNWLHRERAEDGPQWYEEPRWGPRPQQDYEHICDQHRGKREAPAPDDGDPYHESQGGKCNRNMC